MGRTGIVVSLERNGDAAPLRKLRETVLGFLSQQWDDLLGKQGADEAWGWVSQGEHSLLTIGDSDADDNRAADKLVFWFYRSVDWPMNRAEHYLTGALAAGHEELNDNLAPLGYRIFGHYPTIESVLKGHERLLGSDGHETLARADCPICRRFTRDRSIPPPTDRMRELEKLLAQIRHAGMIALNIDMWQQYAGSNAPPQKHAEIEAELAEASRQRAAAKTALDELVARTRAEAPGELEAWALAHDAYLCWFLDECAKRGESDGLGAFVATRERAEWAEVRAGTRAIVDESLSHVPIDPDRYRRYFGIDPRTLERVGCEM
jgi:hypothetical protein